MAAIPPASTAGYALHRSVMAGVTWPAITTSATLMGETAAAPLGVPVAGYRLYSLEMGTVTVSVIMRGAGMMEGTAAATRIVLRGG